MSRTATILRINYQSYHETTDLQVFDDIEDMDNLVGDTDPQNIILLQGAGEPGKLTTIDNNEDPFTVIRAQQLTIKYVSSNITDSMALFAYGSDQRWRVTRYLGTRANPIWKGYLVIDDNNISEPLLSAPNPITLTANDGLGRLKDQPLVDDAGNNPSGYNTVAQYLAWALKLTGLSLTWRVAFNIKLSDLIDDISIPNTDDEHLFSNIYLDAKTFEAGIGKCISAYETIQRILGHEASLFQYQGKWFIMRIDEVEGASKGLFITTFDADGVFQNNLGEIDYQRNIGSAETIKIVTGTEATSSRPRKSAKLTFSFDLPQEVPCNVDFSRGTNEVVISPTETHLDISCWTLREGYPGGYGSAGGTTAYLRKILTNTYETARYAVLTPRTVEESGSSQPTYIESEGIPVLAGDKFSSSVDWRLNLGIASGGGNYRLFRFILHGNDGSYWILGRPSDTSGSDDTVQWYNTSGFTTNTGRGKTTIDFDTVDEEQWQTISWDAPPLPVSGTLYIWLNQFNQSNVVGDDKQIWYSNLSFSLTVRISETYQKYTGQYHSTSQAGAYKAKIDDTVYVSDSPHPLFKGAMFRLTGGAYVLVSQFYNASVFPGGPPSSDFVHRYGEIQLFDVWNQWNRSVRSLQAQGQGIDLDTTKDSLPYPLGLINKIKITDSTRHTSSRFFILLNPDIDYATAGWSGTMREVCNTTVPKDYSNHVFKLTSDV